MSSRTDFIFIQTIELQKKKERKDAAEKKLRERKMATNSCSFLFLFCVYYYQV